jgi:hypothetical protein
MGTHLLILCWPYKIGGDAMMAAECYVSRDLNLLLNHA